MNWVSGILVNGKINRGSGDGGGGTVTAAQILESLSLQAIASGSWTPTIDNIRIDQTANSGATMTLYDASWMRVGNIVDFQSRFEITPTVGGETLDLDLTFPTFSGFNITDFYGSANVRYRTNNPNDTTDDRVGALAGGLLLTTSATDVAPFTKGSLNIGFDFNSQANETVVVEAHGRFYLEPAS